MIMDRKELGCRATEEVGFEAEQGKKEVFQHRAGGICYETGKHNVFL